MTPKVHFLVENSPYEMGSFCRVHNGPDKRRKTPRTLNHSTAVGPHRPEKRLLFCFFPSNLAPCGARRRPWGLWSGSSRNFRDAPIRTTAESSSWMRCVLCLLRGQVNSQKRFFCVGVVFPIGFFAFYLSLWCRAIAKPAGIFFCAVIGLPGFFFLCSHRPMTAQS